MTLVEQVARELCRWDYSFPNLGTWFDTGLDSEERRRYRREARNLVKMVCGSCGLANPLMGKEGEKDA